ncbi:hypothetical protein S40288_00613 [Stachybotrys chartarum IBT 40288]|nr:hypothetical protein S40288_00613 [Stachybotrys chartarum IBT 40288]
MTASPTLHHDASRGSHSTTNAIHQWEDQEAQDRYDEEMADRGLGALHGIRSRTRSQTSQTVIQWKADDLENPHNWSKSRKITVIVLTVVLVLNSTMGSALPSMAIPAIAQEFGVTSELQMPLPISVYLIGFVIGAVVWGPLSEQFGRKYPSLATIALYTIFTMACPLAPNWTAFLIFRLMCGIHASAPIAIVAGILADIYDDPRTRGRAYAVFMVTTVFGPLFAPILSGFAMTTIGWRWAFWIALIIAGTSFITTLFLPETFGPVLLARRAAKLRRQDPSFRVVAPRDLEEANLSQLLTVVLTRPVRMVFTELIVSASCAYLALVYSIFYMSFQVFPIVFRDLYGLAPGVTGLTYLPIGLGACLAMPIFWYWDHVLYSAKDRGAAWVKREEYRRLPLACIGGPMFVVSLFWLGFSARTSISFVVPMLAGIPFGMGFVLIFMAMLNYLTDAYEIFAASANSAASLCRSAMAVVLPLATGQMFDSLGISGACSLLGGLSALMCFIPFIFIWKGPTIRARSRFCIALRQRKEEMMREEGEHVRRSEK